MLESLEDDHSIDQRTSVSENVLLLVELKERHQQVRWALQWCLDLEKKYDVPDEDRIYRPRPLKRGKGYTPTKATRIVVVKMRERKREEGEKEKEGEGEEKEKEVKVKKVKWALVSQTPSEI